MSAPRPRAKRVVAPSLTGGSAPRLAIDRREEILLVSREIFYQRGFDTGSMREIAQRLGITQASLYYHFENKEQILFTLLDQFTCELIERLQEILTGPGSGLDTLASAIRHQVVINEESFREVKLVIQDRNNLSDDLQDQVKERERRIFALYRSRIAQLIKAGTIRSVSATVLTFTLLSVVNSIYQWYKPGGALSIFDIADEIVSNLMEGMISPQGRAEWSSATIEV